MTDSIETHHSNATLAGNVQGAAPGEPSPGILALRLYEAVFARKPDLAGLEYHADLLDSGVSLHTITESFIDSAEFEGIYGADPSEEAILTALYQNALGRAPDTAGFNYWKGLLDSDKVDIADVIVAFVECPENDDIITVQGAAADYTVW